MTERTIDLVDLGNGFAKLDITGLEIIEQKPTVFQFIEARDAIINRGQEADWGIADLFIFGEKLFGEDVWQFIDDQRIVRKTVQNKVWVARRFPKHRRRAGLTISHHGAVAVLVGNEDHPEWEALAYEKLERAERDGLSVEDLEEETRTLTGRETPISTPPTALELIHAAYDDATKALKELQTEPMKDVRDLVQTAVDSLSDAAEILE